MKLLAPAALFVVVILCASPVLAWEQMERHGQPVKYPHAAITHSGPPELDAMVAQALGAWGAQSAITDGGPGSDIVIEWTDDPGVAYGGAFVGKWIGNSAATEGCRVLIRSGKPETTYATVLHEVGHCLGLDHNGQYDTVMGGAMVPELAADDIAGALSLYPVSRLVVPMVAR